MNDVCYDKTVEFLRKGKQVMVFVHARNSTVKTGMTLKEMAQNKAGCSDEMCQNLNPFVNQLKSSLGRCRTLRARGISPAWRCKGVDGQVSEQAAGGAVRLRHRDPPRGDAAQRQEPRRETLRAGTHQGMFYINPPRFGETHSSRPIFYVDARNESSMVTLLIFRIF